MPSLADLLRSQNFGPNDSLIASSINHPLRAGKKLSDWIARQTQTAAGIPEQYDNPNPLLAPSPTAQSQAAFDLAGLVQGGAMPFAPKSAGGTLGTLVRHGVPDTEYSKAHETARKNAVKLLGLPEDNTAMDRAKAMGFDVEGYHGSNVDVDYLKTPLWSTSNADYANGYGENPKNIIYPILSKTGNFVGFDDFDNLVKMQDAKGLVNKRKSANDYLDLKGIDSVQSNDKNNVKISTKSKNIRSRFAAFDPAKKDSADLLASKLLPATMLGYGMANQRSLSDYFGAQ